MCLHTVRRGAGGKAGEKGEAGGKGEAATNVSLRKHENLAKFEKLSWRPNIARRWLLGEVWNRQHDALANYFHSRTRTRYTHWNLDTFDAMQSCHLMLKLFTTHGFNIRNSKEKIWKSHLTNCNEALRRFLNQQKTTTDIL